MSNTNNRVISRTVKKEDYIELSDGSGRWFDKSGACFMASREIYEGQKEMLYRVGTTYVARLYDVNPGGSGEFKWNVMSKEGVDRFMKSCAIIPIEFLDIAREIK